MAEYTSNYNLEKQQGNEYINIEGLNSNFDTIDEELKRAQDRAEEAFQSASNGKQLIAGAITGKGVPTNPSDTFQKMADNINAIETDMTGDATATAGDLLSGKTAYVKGKKITGTIPSKGAATITPGTVNQTIEAGQYLSGAQTIVGDTDLIPANILAGKNIFGVAGSALKGHFASGQILSPTMQSENFTAFDGTTKKKTFITVSGLTFKPKMIIYIAVDGASLRFCGFYTSQENPIYPELCYTSNDSTAFYKADVSPAYVNSSGFHLPTPFNGYTYYWYALG